MSPQTTKTHFPPTNYCMFSILTIVSLTNRYEEPLPSLILCPKVTYCTVYTFRYIMQENILVCKQKEIIKIMTIQKKNSCNDKKHLLVEPDVPQCRFSKAT